MNPRSGASRQELLRQVADLTERLREAEEALRAIREGEVDAIVVAGPHGDQVFSLSTSDIAYRLVVQTMSEAALTTTLDGRILFCNAQFGRLLGIPMEELVGRRFPDLAVGANGDVVAALIRESGARDAKRRIVFAGSSGPVPALVSATLLEQPDGPTVCIVALDLSELEASTEAIEKLRTQQELLRKSTECFELLSRTASALLRSWDPAADVALLHRVMQALDCQVFMNHLVDEGSGLLRLNAHDGITEEMARRMETLELRTGLCSSVGLKGERFVAEGIQAGSDPAVDHLRPLGIDAYVCHPLVAQGRILGTLSFGARDRPRFAPDELSLVAALADQVAIALQRTLSEAAVVRAKETLEARVAERTEELQRTNRELELRTRQLRNLAGELAVTEQRERRRLAGMLHDHLQQLLVGARYQVEALRRRGGVELRQAIDQMDELVGQSIEVSRSLTAELSPPVLHTSGLGPSLEWLAQWMSGKQNLAVALSLPPEMPAMGEDVTVQLFQSTRELLFNVVKHAQARQAVLEVTVAGDTLRIVVSDRGVGFDLASLREKAGTESFGLFSIRERLGLIGGELKSESEPGKGSRFTLSVPVRNLASTAGDGDGSPLLVGVGPRPTGNGTPAKTRVLLVDDHEVTRKGLAQLLAKDADLEVVGEASDGGTATKLADVLRPDVVVMDVNMPGMSGIEATRIILGRQPSARVVALSMYEDEGIVSAMRDAGAAAYVSKSESPRLLLEAIRSCARRGAREG